MKCLCCFNEEFPLHEINSVDRKSYHQLTNLNSSDLVDQKKICGNCRKRLKEYSSFLVQCRKSYDLIKKSGSAPQKSVKRRSPRKSPAENIKIVVEFSQDAAADSPSLLSPVEMLLDDEITTAESLDKEEHTKKDQQTIVLDTIESKLNVGESFSSKLNRSCSSKIWQCDTCGKEFATKFRLTTHIRVHSKEKPYNCEVCNLSFAQGNALKCHRRIHFNERPFVCKYCSRSFTQKTTLKTHMAAKHTGKQIACDEPGCDKKFTRRSFFLIHKRDHLGIRKYPCENCSKTYKHKSHLTRHVEASHLKVRHECNFPECKAVFTTSWTLKMHKFTHSTESSQLPYQCEICHDGFNRRDKWLKHLSKSHPNTNFNVPESLEIPNIRLEDPKRSQDAANSKILILSASDNVYSIENDDGMIYQIQTMEVVQS